jgi:hypothetical protein
MSVQVGDELRKICRRILAEGLSEHEWAARESDDMFQSRTYVGGFDATETAFCFSYDAPDGSEQWFQLTLGEVNDVAEGKLTEVPSRPAE